MAVLSATIQSFNRDKFRKRLWGTGGILSPAQRVASTCKRMRKEAEFFDSLNARFPESVLRVRYESLKENAEAELSRIFAFVGLPWGELQRKVSFLFDRFLSTYISG